MTESKKKKLIIVNVESDVFESLPLQRMQTANIVQKGTSESMETHQKISVLIIVNSYRNFSEW
jgi:hypothetical protein